MYLKSLNIKGFKSFAKKTTLDFETGVTVIVGPNGSGKSNLTDAILWVLGEQSPRSLRGSMMEDVIFSGSSSKPASGLAEVSLTLDNSDGYLAIDFAEVTITRRMLRSGQSDYFINGSTVRLIDIQDLLSDIGLGREVHCIIGQGRIDEVLSSRSDEKRLLIEEVAGVLKHRKRKERAVKKLQGMEQNLLRIKDIAKEVERQLNPLREQAKLAERAAKLSEQIRSLESSMIIFELYNLQSEWKNKASKSNLIEEDLIKISNEVKSKRSEMERIQAELEEKGDFVGDIGEHRRELKGIMERLNSGLLLLEEKGKYLIEKMSELRMQIYRLESGIRSKEEEASKIDQKMEMLKGEMESVQKERLAQDSLIDEAAASLLKLEKELSDIKLELAQNQSIILEKERQLKEVQLEMETQRVEERMLRERLLSAEGVDRKLADEAEALELELKSVTLNLESGQSKVDEIASRLSKIEEDISISRTLKRKQDEELLSAQSKISLLAANLESGAHYPDSIKRLISKGSDTNLGVLSDLLEVEEGYEIAIEAALGEGAYSLLTKDLDGAKRAALGLKAENSGFASIIPLLGLGEGIEIPKAPESYPSALEKVQIDDSLKPLLKRILGSFLIVNDLEEAFKIILSPKNRFDLVTVSGDIVKKEGVIRVAKAESFGSIVHKTDLARLKKRKDSIEESLKAQDSKIEALDREREELEAKLKTAKEALKEIEKRFAETTLKLSSIREHSIKRKEELKAESDRLTEIEDASKSSDDRLKSLASLLLELKREAFDLNKIKEERESELIVSIERLTELKSKSRESEGQTSLRKDNLEMLRAQLVVQNKELNGLKKELETGNKTVLARESLRLRIQPLHELFATLFERAKEIDENLASLATNEKVDTKKSRERYKSLSAETTLIDVKKVELEKETSLIEVEKGQLKVKISDLTKRLVDEFNIELKDALASAPKRINLLEFQEKLKKLKESHAKIGPVNEVAAVECLNLEERYNFLNDQMADLKRSRSSLLKVTKVIEEKLIDRFNSTFEEVNSNFKEIFSRLFPGGEASLILIGDEDLLSCGIEIEANPVGKRLSKITLLSGGERSLVALALLFAIYHTKPSPFYLLDEVEPALDDNNLIRFLTLLEAERRNTQFLIITHQRRTMEIADSLYGVSMQSDGISSVISQRLDRLNDKAS